MSGRIKIAAGVDLELSQVFRGHHNALVLYAERYLGSRSESMSVVQDVFVVLMERRQPFESEERMRMFLYTATRNRALDILRKRKTADNYLRNTAEPPHYEERLAFVEEETFRQLFVEIDLLPAGQRGVVLLALDGKGNDEIAGLLDISVNTVKFHKKNAYKILRGKLADHYLLSFLL